MSNLALNDYMDFFIVRIGLVELCHVTPALDVTAGGIKSLPCAVGGPMLPRQVAFSCSAGSNVPPLDLLLCSHAASQPPLVLIGPDICLFPLSF